MKKCPKCNKLYTDGKFCEVCGGQLVDVENDEEQEEVPVVEGKEKKCANCGATLKEDDMFCPECGQGVGGGQLSPTTELESAERSQKKKGPNKKNIILAVIAAVLFIGACGFYFWGKEHYSFENQVNQFIDGLSKNDPDVIAYLTTDDPNFEMTEESIQPLFEYINENKEYLSDLKASLLTGAGNGEIQVTQSGKQMLLFDNYKFVVTPVYVTVTTGLEDMTILVNEKEIATSDSTDYQKEVGPLAPGVNVFTGKVMVGKEEQEISRSIDLVPSTSDYSIEEVDLTIQVMSFTVESNVKDGEILLDGESVATLENGKAKIGPLAWYDGMVMQVVKSFDSGNLKSEIYEISQYDDGEVVTLDVESAADEATVYSFLDDFYSQVNSFLSDYNDYGSGEQAELAEFFTNGKENDDFIDFNTYISENREREDASVSVYFDDVAEVLQVDANKFQVVFSVNYHTYYDDWDKDAVQNNLKYTKAIFEYDEENETLTISDLGGEDDVVVTTE